MIDAETMQGIRLVLFDFNSTLVQTKSGKTFMENAQDWQVMEDRPYQIGRVKHLYGVQTGICTNQGGVAYGFTDAAELGAEIMKAAAECEIDRHLISICFTHPNGKIDEYRVANDERRKPRPGMLLEAMREADATPAETIYVGDRPEDRAAAKNAGCKFILTWDFFDEEMPVATEMDQAIEQHLLAARVASDAMERAKGRLDEHRAAIQTLLGDRDQPFHAQAGIASIVRRKSVVIRDRVDLIRMLGEDTDQYAAYQRYVTHVPAHDDLNSLLEKDVKEGKFQHPDISINETTSLRIVFPTEGEGPDALS